MHTKRCLENQNVEKRSKGVIIGAVVAIVVCVVVLVIPIFKVASISIHKNAEKLAAFEKQQDADIQEEVALQELIEKNKK